MKQLKDYLHEVWKPIPGFIGYEASDMQRIRSIDRYVKHNYGGTMIKRGRILTQHVNVNGYKACGLCLNGVEKTRVVHRLIALAFHPNPENKATVNHIDGDKWNNVPSNLEWATQSENVQHAWDTGLNGKSPRSFAQQTFCKEAAKKPVVAKNFRTGEERPFNSIMDCAKGLGVTQSCISYAIARGGKVHRKYQIKFAA